MLYSRAARVTSPRTGARPDDRTAPPQTPPLAHSAAWRLAATVARILVGLLGVPIFTRALGMSQWGLLALFHSATAPLILLDFGFSTATVKYVAESIGRGDRAAAVRVAHTTVLFNLAVGAIGAVALGGLAPWLAAHAFAIPDPDVPRATLGFRLAGVAWLIAVLTSPFSGVLAAHQRYDVLSRVGTASVVASTALGVTVAALTRDVVATLAAQVLVSAVVLAVYVGIANRLLPGVAALPRGDARALRRSFSMGGWQSISSVGALLSGWSDRYVLGAVFLPATLGFYAVVQSLYSQLYGAFTELSEVLYPAVSHREGSGDLATARRLTLLAAWTITTAYGVCAAVLATVGPDFLHLWISPEVAREAGPTLRLLCVGGIIGMAAIPPFHYVLGLGRTRWHAASSILIGTIVLGSAVLLVPRMGLAGVGLGLIAGVLARWGFVAGIARVHFRDEPFGAFALHVFAPPITSVLLLGAGVLAHDALAPPRTWIGLVAETIVAFAAIGLAQVAAGELLPGGPQRRRDVVSSIWAVVRRRPVTETRA